MKRCDTCEATFNPTNNRNKFCKPCVAKRKKANDRRYKQEAQELNRKNYLCGCGTIFSPVGNQKRCNDCVAKAKEDKKCKACDNILPRRGLTYCKECRDKNKVKAYKKQAGERRAKALLVKHGLITAPTPEEDKLPSKFTTRGKINYQGYREL